ncbi:MAG: hypothetical protein ABI969_03055 [bacterium]
MAPPLHRLPPDSMPERATGGNIDIANFSVGDMLRAGLALRQVVGDADSSEEAATRVVRYLYDNCVDRATGKRACALVRFYKTHPLGDLNLGDRQFAEGQLGSIAPDPSMRCLALLCTVGDEPAWNDRRHSRSHRVIPLPSADIVRRAPMIARLIEQLGLEIESVVGGVASSRRLSEAPTYDVFYVEHALGSPHIPAQAEFVAKYGIASVVGFGGQLRSGEIFVVILFARIHIPAKSAARFKTIALDVRSALFTFPEDRTWKTL